MGAELATVGLARLLVASISRRLSGSPVMPAMVVVAIGLLVGPLRLDELTVAPTRATLRRLAEGSTRACAPGCLSRGSRIAARHRRSYAADVGTRRSSAAVTPRWAGGRRRLSRRQPCPRP